MVRGARHLLVVEAILMAGFAGRVMTTLRVVHEFERVEDFMDLQIPLLLAMDTLPLDIGLQCHL